MKIRTYIRIAKGTKDFQVSANIKPDSSPLTKYNGASLPTVGFAIDFDLEDDIFEQMQHPIAEIKVTKNIIKGNVKIPSKGEMAIDKLKNQ